MVTMGLSPLESRCLRMAADGLTREQMALKLNIGLPTAKSSLHRAFIKLGANNAAHAIAIAFRTGLFKPEDWKS